MIRLNEIFEVDRRNLKCDYIRYIPAETSTINTINSQIYFNIPREDSVICLLSSYLDLNFEVIKRADNSRYDNGDDIRLVNLGPIAFFHSLKLTSSSGKHLEDISRSHIVSLIYKQVTAKKSDDLSIGFDRSRDRRKQQLTNNRNVNGKFHVRIMLKDVFGFAEGMEKSTYGLGYNLTLTRNNDDAVLQKAVALADARVKIDLIHWYILHYVPSIQQQGILSKQVSSKTPTKLSYIEPSVFMKEIYNQKFRNFKLGSQESMKVPIRIIIGFQQRDRQDS